MDFAKIYPFSLLPTSEDGYLFLISAPRDIDIPANKVYNIELELMLFRLPLDNILKLVTLNQFKILNKFWLPSCNALTIPVITPKPLHINRGDPLCQLHLMTIGELLPGKKKKKNKKNKKKKKINKKKKIKKKMEKICYE